MFSPDKLQKVADDPLPGQVQEPPKPVEINNNEDLQHVFPRQATESG